MPYHSVENDYVAMYDNAFIEVWTMIICIYSMCSQKHVILTNHSLDNDSYYLIGLVWILKMQLHSNVVWIMFKSHGWGVSI